MENNKNDIARQNGHLDDVIAIKRGMTFRNLQKVKCHIANVFNEGEEEVVTYRWWSKRSKRWVFETDFKDLFLIAFDYGWKWEH